MGKINPHPMILPHVPRDSPQLHALGDDARRAYTVLYDMVDGYASGQPVWAVTRYVVEYGGALYGAMSRTLIESGWRAVSSLARVPVPSEPFSGVPELSPSDAPAGWVKVVGRRREAYRFFAASPSSLRIGDFIAHMESTGLGRPSTYASHAQNLLDHRLIVDGDDVQLTSRGRSMLAGLRSSTAARFDAAYCRAFLRDLDDIAAGTLDVRNALRGWLSAGHAEIAADWIDTMTIVGDPADLAYELRDDADRTTVFWPAGMLPESIDPEHVLAPDAPERTQRHYINQCAASLSEEQWLQMPASERTDCRIRVAAEFEGTTPTQWRQLHRFDLLKRWMVGWPLPE